MSVDSFTSQDFLSTLIFGAGGFILFYLTPLVIFVYFYLQFRGNNEEVTIEGFLFRYIFYSIVSIIGGGFIFSLLSVFSFSSVTSPVRGLYYFLQIDWTDFDTIANSIKNNSNISELEKDNIIYLALFLMALKIIFNSLTTIPIAIIVYLSFTNIIKCKKLYLQQVTDFNSCIAKKFFFILLFIISLFIVYKFADEVVKYLISHYLNVNTDNINGLLKTSIDMIKKVKENISQFI